MSSNERLKKVVEHLKSTRDIRNQSELSERIGLSRSYMSQLIGGDRDISEQIVHTLVDIFPMINAHWLLAGEGEMLKTEQEDEGIIVTNPNIIGVPLVSKFAYAGYQFGFGDSEYMATLPIVPFIVPSEGTPRGEYIAIEVKGDSMDDGSPESFLEGDVLLCRIIGPHLWQQYKLHTRKWNFVIVTNDGILLKRIIAHDLEKKTITTHSLNEFYPDKVIDLREVRQIMNVVQFMRKPII